MPVMLNRLAGLAIYTTLLLAASYAAGQIGYRNAFLRLEERAQADLELSGDRLVNYLQRYREIAVLLSDHPVLQGQVQGQRSGAVNVGLLLQDVADKTGATGLQLIDRTRSILAQTGDMPTPSDSGAAIRRALNGALGYTRIVTGDGRRLFLYAAPVFTGPGPARGALVIAVSAEAIEWNWPSDPNAVFFTNPDETVFISNRSELNLKSRPGAPGSTIPLLDSRKIGDHDLWQLEAGPYLPSRALHVAREMPVINLTAEILVDAVPATRTAIWQAAGVLGLGLALGMIGYSASERRRALAERLAAQQSARAELEHRVQERTAALSDANRMLRREIAEREEAEAALRRAQDELVQAAKLSALGKMSAGISHELNQPLMAIRSFAENGAAFIARGQPQIASDNFDRISELARRMGRIIKNLRAFARQEKEPLSNVDLAAVVEAVLELTDGRIKNEDVTLDWHAPGVPMLVRGGEVRLQQVVMNLVSNALDAMQGSAERRLEISTKAEDGLVKLMVRDTGPGIADPERIFDPFYSTKTDGSADGMGLGLSISYGLVQSFGGVIRGHNHEAGGAVFTVELTPVLKDQAA